MHNLEGYAELLSQMIVIIFIFKLSFHNTQYNLDHEKMLFIVTV